MFRLSIDDIFRQRLIQVVGNFADSKILKPAESGWCMDLRHMILKKEWDDVEITSSYELATAIQNYCTEHLSGSFRVLWIDRFSIQTSKKLKKQLLHVIDTELTDALFRELLQRDSFIHDSENAEHLKELSTDSERVSRTLIETRGLLEARELEVLEQADEIDGLREENEGLQQRLGKALEDINKLTRDIVRLNRRLEVIPDLQKELKSLREELLELRSGQETLSRSFYGKSVSDIEIGMPMDSPRALRSFTDDF